MGGQTQRRDPVTVSDATDEREHARVVNGRLWVDVISGGGGGVVDTELPAAGLLGDSVANPTTPVIAAYIHARNQNATTYSRVSSELANSNTLGVTGDRGVHTSDIVKYHLTAELSNVNRIYNSTVQSTNSQAIDCSRFRKFMLYYALDSTSSPTDIQFIVQFSRDSGTTWHNYRNNFWGQLVYDDVACATEIFRCHDGDCVGDMIRLRVVATGTSAANRFEVDDCCFGFKN